MCGLHSGFKSECIKRFPSSWNQPKEKVDNTYHFFDGMCTLHAFSLDESNTLENGLEQLFEYFRRTFDSRVREYRDPKIVLVFDITYNLPMTKLAELEKRSRDKKAVETPGDVKNGIMPEPFDAALSDRRLRMEICSELSKKLLSHYTNMIFYGHLNGGFQFIDSSYQDILPIQTPLHIFGEADISIPYAIKMLEAQNCVVHTVDTDLIPIIMSSLESSSADVCVNLSHYDQKEKKRIHNSIDISIFRQEIRTKYNMSVNDFMCVCILQGTDFIERVISRGSWSTLFDIVEKKEFNDLVKTFQNGVEIDTRKLIQILYKLSPKTVAASGSKKRKKVELGDITIDKGLAYRICWQILYWKESIHVGYNRIEKITANGWDLDCDMRLKKKVSTKLAHDDSFILSLSM